jgi:hypothetical protein
MAHGLIAQGLAVGNPIYIITDGLNAGAVTEADAITFELQSRSFDFELASRSWDIELESRSLDYELQPDREAP